MELLLGCVHELKHLLGTSCWDFVGAECPLPFIQDKDGRLLKSKMQLRIFRGGIQWQHTNHQRIQQEVNTGAFQK